MSENIQKGFTTQAQRSNGGKNRAKNLSSERRREIAILATQGRKCFKDLPKATHTGKLIIGDLEIECAVLDNGTRLISESSAFKILGRKRKGRKKKGMDQVPVVISAKNLSQYIPESFFDRTFEVEFYKTGSGKSKGYEASFIPKICQVYLDARRAGVLTPQQHPVAAQAEIVVQALANVGISALIDECTGYQKQRENDELQKLFEKFIAKELQPWVKRFPLEFFNHFKRIYGIENMRGTPSYFGSLINKYVYKQLSPEIHEELKRLNPVTDKNYRRHAHHQFLTQDVGSPALNKQIQKMITLLSISDTKEELENFLEKSREK